MQEEPILLEECIVVNSIPCRMWMHPDDASVFVTMRSRDFYPYAEQYDFLPYYEPPVPRVYFRTSTCPCCGAVLKADLYPRGINAKYAIYCKECGSKYIAKSNYDQQTIEQVKNEREAIPIPDKKTLMMQILAQNPVEAEARINYFLNPGVNKFGFPDAAKTGGAVFLQDYCKGLLSAAEDYYNLWFLCFAPGFREMHMIDTYQPIYVMRFRTGQNEKLYIPYSYEFGGNFDSSFTYDGSGFIAIPGGKIPLYQYKEYVKISGGIIVRIDPDGTERNIAVFNPLSRKFVFF